jgi:hypothetical protein
VHGRSLQPITSEATFIATNVRVLSLPSIHAVSDCLRLSHRCGASAHFRLAPDHSRRHPAAAIPRQGRPPGGTPNAKPKRAAPCCSKFWPAWNFDFSAGSLCEGLRVNRPETEAYYSAPHRPTVSIPRVGANEVYSVQPLADEDFSDDFEPDPPTFEEIDFDNNFEHIICFFIRASRGDDIAWNISNGMLSIHTLTQRRSDLRPDERQRDRLLAEIARAHATALLELPRDYSREQLAIGMNALAGIVMRLAEADEQRASWHPDVIRDLHAYARMLRNDLHNISLAEEIEERAEKRRAQTIAALHQFALTEREAR